MNFEPNDSQQTRVDKLNELQSDLAVSPEIDFEPNDSQQTRVQKLQALNTGKDFQPNDSRQTRAATLNDIGPDRRIKSVEIVNPGTGYIAGELARIVGGIFPIRAKLNVVSIGGSGQVTAVTIYESGDYTAIPSNPANTRGETSNADTLTVNITWENFVP